MPPVVTALEARLLPELAEALAPFEIEQLEADATLIEALTPDLRLGYVNPAWIAAGSGFAEFDPWAWLGRNVLEAIGGPLRAFYANVYADVARRGRPFTHEYACPTAVAHRRWQMAVYPLRVGGHLVTRACIGTSPALPTPGAIESAYRDAAGFVRMCGNCRRTRNPVTSTWDWVPPFVDRAPASTSHGLCAPCYGFFYPPEDD